MTRTDTATYWRRLFDELTDGEINSASTSGYQPDAYFARLGRWIAEMLRLETAEKTLDALDIGCANGRLTKEWGSYCRSVIGVDFSERLIAIAMQHFATETLRFQVADATKLPFPDATFDRVCSYSVLLCLPDHDHVAKAIDEIIRVTRPGGRILLGDFPDRSRQHEFFRLADRRRPWLIRAIPRRWRWALKRLIRPKIDPTATRILWFEPAQLVADLAARGLTVTTVDAPDFGSHNQYRFSLLIECPETLAR